MMNMLQDAWWWSGVSVNRPDAPALVDPDGTIISRARLRAQIAGVANALASCGVLRQHRLALVMSPGSDMAIALLAAMAVVTVAPMVPGSPLAAVLEELQAIKATHLLVDENTQSSVAEAAGRLGIAVMNVSMLRKSSRIGVMSLGPRMSDLALLLQTSGTTSRPKQVPLTIGNLLLNAKSVADVLALGHEDVSLAAMPMFHIHGIVASLMAPLIAGGSVICCRGRSPQHLLKSIQFLRPTWVSAVPTLLHAVLNASEQKGSQCQFSGLRFLRASSASLPPVLQQRLEDHFGVPVLEAYGMTECYLICSNRLPGDGPTPVPGSVGPAAGPELTVLGPQRAPLPPGASGEVAIRGPNVTAGYEAADHSGWITAADGESWFLTGDEGYLDQQGRLFLTGRLKEMINRGGEKVIPRRVDEVLLQHPAVEQALAFAVPHATLGEDLAAAVVLRPSVQADEQTLRHHAFKLLAPHEVPSQIVLLQELPRGATGKLQRIGLANKLGALLQRSEEHASGEIEQLVAETFAAVLQQPPPGRNANFFQLGGDSLSGQRAVIQLEQQLALALSPTLLFAYPTVRSLAEQLDKLLDQALAQAQDFAL